MAETKTLREQITLRRRMLIDSYVEWLKGRIKSGEYNQLATEFDDSLLLLMRSEIKAVKKENPYKGTGISIPASHNGWNAALTAVEKRME